MRLALLLDRWDSRRGGLEGYAARWAAWLSKRGHEVHVVCWEAAPGSAGELPVHRPANPRPFSPVRAARQLSRLAGGLGVDVVHDFGAGLGGDVFHPLYGGRRSGRRAQLTALDPLSRISRLASPCWIGRQAGLERLERLQVRDPARLVVACSRRVAADLVGTAGADPVRVRILYNAAAPRGERAGSGPLRSALRAAQGWPEESVVFLQAAHNPVLKGLATSIRAVEILRRQGLDVRLAVAGRNTDTSPFRFLATRLGVQDRVAFLGFVPDLGPFFDAADAFVHPTLHDACSLVCLEALAAGLPVAVSVRDGASELVTDGVQGWLIREPSDPREVAFQMKRLLDPGLRGALGAQASVLASLHTEQAAFTKLEGLCAEEAGKR